MFEAYFSISKSKFSILYKYLVSRHDKDNSRLAFRKCSLSNLFITHVRHCTTLKVIHECCCGYARIVFFAFKTFNDALYFNFTIIL